MKHFFLIIIILLLLFLVNSCAGVPPLGADANATAVAQTLTAMSWTAMPSPTFNAYIPDMINWLNNDLAAISPLSGLWMPSIM